MLDNQMTEWTMPLGDKEPGTITVSYPDRDVTVQVPAVTTILKGYKLCPECGQPILKKGQQRKHPDDYRHAQGCPNAD